MSLAVGIVGLPNVGKTTLFNALTRAKALVATYAFSTVEPNTAVVPVPDERLAVLAAIYRAKKVTPATMTFVDVAGLVAGASRGEGMGNRFLASLREADALAMVVRCFEDPEVPYAGNRRDPSEDMAAVNLELILADLELVLKRREKLASTARFRPAGQEHEEVVLLDRLRPHLDAGFPVRTLSLQPEEAQLLKALPMLTAKPMLYVANIGDRDLGKKLPQVESVRLKARQEGADVVELAARFEADLGELPEEDARAFLKDAGLDEPALHPFIRHAYGLLHLVTFFTGNDNELRAWTAASGTRAPQAAGVVHSDFERGFIKAEIVSFDDLARAGSYASARERGKVRLEGRDYALHDGDVALFRFNV